MGWEFFNPHEGIDKHGPKLPHWQQGEAMQFVTFRLKDALPQQKLHEWRMERERWLAWNPRPWDEDRQAEYDRRFPARLKQWLDSGAGSCLLRDPTKRAHLEESLMHFHGERVTHEAWVIMPNHVHALFRPLMAVSELVKAWKGVSARRIGEGPVWQQNYRDTLIRGPGHFARVVRYIRSNPGKAGLREGEFSLWEGARARQVG